LLIEGCAALYVGNEDGDVVESGHDCPQ
jgi:hypothetical protein